RSPSVLLNSGLPGGTRTHNPQLRRLVLYPVELRAASRTNPANWSGWRDLNTRHLAPKASALPGCATPRKRGQMIPLAHLEINLIACGKGLFSDKKSPLFLRPESKWP